MAPTENPFLGRESSCRPVCVFFDSMEKEGGDPAQLARGTGLSIGHLRDRNERISWDAFCRVLTNAREHWGPERFAVVAGSFGISRFARPFTVIARQFFTLGELYQWLTRPGGPMTQMCSCIDFHLVEIDSHHHVAEYRLHEGYEDSAVFFEEMVPAGMRGTPRVLGLRDAEVEVTRIPRGGRYAIYSPRVSGVLTSARRAITSPFRARAAARELQEALETLQKRNGELLKENHERKKTEVALRESEARLEEAQRVARIGSWEWDLDQSRVTWSSHLYRMLGLDPAQSSPCLETFLRVVHPDDVATVEKEFFRAFACDDVFMFDARIVTNSGDERILLCEGRTIIDESDDRRRIVGAVRDITDERQGERDRTRLEAQLFHAHKMQAIGTLAGGIAHDFNNILAVILGKSELSLETTMREPQIRQNLMEIQTASLRARELVKQILAFSRNEVGETKIIDVRVPVEEALRFLRSLRTELDRYPAPHS